MQFLTRCLLIALVIAAGNHSASAASNCPSQIITVDTGREYYGMHDLFSYEIVSTNPISIRARGGTRFLKSLPGSPAGDQWNEGHILTDIDSILHEQRRSLEFQQRRISTCSQSCCDTAASLCSMERDNQAKRVKWLECVASNKRGSVSANAGAGSTQSRPNVGNASEVIGQRSSRKNAFNPSSQGGGQRDTHTSSSLKVAGASGAKRAESTSHPTSGVRPQAKANSSKYVSKEVNHCVEIIPKEFKGCKYKRCLYNACPEKISVRWKGGGSGGWGMVDLANGRSWPVNNLGDDGSYVYFQACSWDPKAGPNHGPYVTGGCRY